MTDLAQLENDPDVLWIQLRTALREGRLADAADAQRKLAAAGITVVIDGLTVRHRAEGRYDG